MKFSFQSINDTNELNYLEAVSVSQCVCVCVCVCNGPAHMLIRMNSGKVMAIQHPSLYLSVTLSVFLSFCFTPDTKSKANGFFFFFFIFFFFLGFFFFGNAVGCNDSALTRL